MIFGAEDLSGELLAAAVGVMLFLLTVGTGLAGWALRELVRLTNAVTKLEQVVSHLAEKDRDHEHRIAALEHGHADA